MAPRRKWKGKSDGTGKRRAMGLIAASAARRTFHTLDGLRGVAAAAVVTLHYQAALGTLLLPGAYLAVDLFFMMSGIVIAHAYDDKLAGGLTARRFLLMRFVRLFPLYFVAWAVATAVVVAALAAGMSTWRAQDMVPAALFGAAMLPNPVSPPGADLYPLNAPAWSLLWELAINLLYAATFRWLSLRVLLAVCGLSAFGVIALAAWHGDLDVGVRWSQWHGGAIRVSFAFTLGVILERWRRMGGLDGLAGAMPRVGVPAMLLLGTAAALALPARAGWAKDPALVLLVFPLLCAMAIARADRPQRVFAFLGLVSYPLYVIHIPLPYGPLVNAVTHAPLSAFAPYIGVTMMAASTGVAWLLARWFDPRARRFLAGRLLDNAAGRRSIA